MHCEPVLHAFSCSKSSSWLVAGCLLGKLLSVTNSSKMNDSSLQSKPFNELKFGTFWQFDCILQIESGVKRCLGSLVQRVPNGAGFEFFLWSKGLRRSACAFDWISEKTGREREKLEC